MTIQGDSAAGLLRAEGEENMVIHEVHLMECLGAPG